MKMTSIEYLDMTWNPIAMRCTPVSAGCEHCWHLRMAKRMSSNPMIPVECRSAYASPCQRKVFGGTIYGFSNSGKPVLKTHELAAPLKRKKPSRIGVQFMGDMFHESVPFEWIAAVYGVMAASPQHTYFILTKRPERRFEFFEWVDTQSPKDAPTDKLEPWWRAFECVLCFHDTKPLNSVDLSGLSGSTWPLQNVLDGVSVENQETADERILWLLKTPAEKRWVSYEPSLSHVNFRHMDIDHGEFFFVDSLTGKNTDMGRPCRDVESLDLIVSGAETGPGARPADLDWFRSARDQCADAGVPFFFKQDSSGSRLLDGRKHEELP